MNNFLEKKLGEAIAFSEIGLKICKEAGETFTKAMGESFFYQKMMQDFSEVASTRATKVSKDKAKKTSKKLHKMMDTYMENDWDKPVEILEWMSFFFSAGATHWSIISVAAKEEGDKILHKEAQNAHKIFTDLLDQVNVRIRVKTEQKLVPA